MALDASGVWIPEGSYSFVSKRLDELLRELDMRLNGANCFMDITRVNDLITTFEFFADVGRTTKVAERQITRDVDSRITGILTIIYNADGSEDSRITSTLTRDVDGLITACDNVLTSTEPDEI